MTFYRNVLQILQGSDVPFLIGGAAALAIHTGIHRDTKDLDIFLRRTDVDRALTVCRQAGLEAELVFPHWLGKVRAGEHYVDVIFSSGNGLCAVDDEWFRQARDEHLWDVAVRVCPPEEMIWQKAYVMERERYDGADVAHLLAHCGETLDWKRLRQRFGPDGLVLLAHLTLFLFIYPAARQSVPPELVGELLAVLTSAQNPARPICRGTLLSRAQFLTDVGPGGLVDARTEDRCDMTADDLRIWTEAIFHGDPA